MRDCIEKIRRCVVNTILSLYWPKDQSSTGETLVLLHKITCTCFPTNISLAGFAWMELISYVLIIFCLITSIT